MSGILTKYPLKTNGRFCIHVVVCKAYQMTVFFFGLGIFWTLMFIMTSLFIECGWTIWGKTNLKGKDQVVRG